MIPGLALAALLLAAASGPRPASSARPALVLEHIGSDSTAFDVIATLIIGPTEVLLWDAQYHVADSRRVADRIAATGKRLKAIIISHPDHDHYMGAATIVERFPGVPVYMTAKALDEFRTGAAGQFKAEKSRSPGLVPDSLVTPQVLPTTHLTVDGAELEIIPDLVGDVKTGTNSILWIPSLQAVLASDLVFNGVHPWLGNSDPASRAAWRRTLQQLESRRPRVVVAGHKRVVDSPDDPEVLRQMDQYLADFDSLRQVSASGPELYQAMVGRYPDLAVAGLLRY